MQISGEHSFPVSYLEVSHGRQGSDVDWGCITVVLLAEHFFLPRSHEPLFLSQKSQSFLLCLGTLSNSICCKNNLF